MDKNFHRKFQYFLILLLLIVIEFLNIFNRIRLVNLFLVRLVYNKKI